ncbi:hypothetical protein RI103_14045 [Paraburkholderia sp. FT54]|uniref:hypothetical protein n=1 Tax=Paraburkholderia sp. FT54 TaxID=3074437 RepID=UPI002877C27B|nr:hypothetical protein [Paraburkholderia sp. FT54]WNC88820.1 hypothetical protein RI103_14045 [Paraburkholderia sp. FT54]
MADILHMPPRPLRKGRRRERPTEGAPLAPVIDGPQFLEPNKPTYAEVKAAVDKLAYHLLGAMRAAKEIFPAYE